MHPRSSLVCTSALAFIFLFAGCGTSVTPATSAAPSTNAGSGPAPTVAAVAEQVDGVAPNRKQEIQFSEAMDPSTINSQTFQIADSSGKSVSGIVAYDPDFHTTTFQPSPALQSNASYSATITTGVASATGVHMAAAYSYNFKTRADSDKSPLAVVGVSPAPNATCVSATTTIVVTFNEVPDASQINTNSIVVKGPDGSVLATTLSTSIAGTQVVIHPNSALPSGTIAVTVQNIGDLAGVMMAGPFTWSFSTACGSTGGATGAEYLYSSAYADGDNIYGFKIDTNTGMLTPLPGSPFMDDAGLQPGCAENCYSMDLLADPAGRFLYYRPSNPYIGSMKVDPATGALTEIGNASGGVNYLSVDPTGKFLYGNSGGTGSGPNSNYIDGWSVPGNGSLSATPGSPYGFPGNNSYGNPAVSNNFVFVTSYFGGGSSAIYGFSIDPNSGALTQVSSTSDGTYGALQVITPSGKFLYSETGYLNGTTGDIEIVGFQVNADGSLTPISMPPQKTPDQSVTPLLISPNGKFLYEEGASALRVYTIDPNTGVLTISVTDSNYHSFDLTFDPTSQFAYATPGTGPQNNIGTDVIQGYSVNQTTGALTAITGATATLPDTPTSIAVVRPQ